MYEVWSKDVNERASYIGIFDSKSKAESVAQNINDLGWDTCAEVWE